MGTLSLAPGSKQAIEARIEAEVTRRIDEMMQRVEARIEAEVEARVQALLAKQGKLHSADKRIESLKSAVESLHGRIARIHEVTNPDMVGEKTVSLLKAFAELRQYTYGAHYRIRNIEVELWPDRFEAASAPADSPSEPVQAKLEEVQRCRSQQTSPAPWARSSLLRCKWKSASTS
jgi:hypothetical protein